MAEVPADLVHAPVDPEEHLQVTIDHPDVAWSRVTCWACPEQYEGQLHDGTWFYLRMRWGRAEFGTGVNLDQAVEHSVKGQAVVIVDRRDGLRGWFRDQAERDQTFRDALDMARSWRTRQ